MMNNIIIFSFIFLLSSCSYFAKKFEISKNEVLPKVVSSTTKELSCVTPSSYQVLGNTESNNIKVQEFLTKINDKIELNFLEKTTIIHLLQMFIRPDQTGPNSKLDIIIRYNGNIHYKSYSSDTHINYFLALNNLLEMFRNKRSLLDLIKLVDQNLKTGFEVDIGLAQFLQKNTTWLQETDQGAKAYFRAKETLKENESLPISSLRLLSNNLEFSSKDKIQSNDLLYTFEEEGGPKYFCNYDMSNYAKGLFYIGNYNIEGNIFGLRDGDEYFLSSTNLKTTKKLIDNSFFIEGSSQTRSPAICFSSRTLLISSYSRDPGQHLYSLITKDHEGIKNLDDLKTINSESRDLILSNPVRILYEATRGSKEELETYLSEKNVPIYYADALGQIWGLYGNSLKNKSFFIDDRTSGNILCK